MKGTLKATSMFNKIDSAIVHSNIQFPEEAERRGQGDKRARVTPALDNNHFHLWQREDWTQHQIFWQRR